MATKKKAVWEWKIVRRAIWEAFLKLNPRKMQRESSFPNTLRFSFHKTLDLRYGENPHQKAAMYSDGSGAGVANALCPQLRPSLLTGAQV